MQSLEHSELDDIKTAIEIAIKDIERQFSSATGEERADLFFLLDRQRRLLDRVTLMLVRN